MHPNAQQVSQMTRQAPPPPWKIVAAHTIAALIAVGYAPDSEYLLVVSNTGRGVFNCLMGERVARDRDSRTSRTGYDEVHLTADGIGPIEHSKVRMAGRHGGGLALGTSDGWVLEVVPLEWPSSAVILRGAVGPYSNPFDLHGAARVSPGGEEIIVACGFSETGRSFVVAQPHTLEIFCRG